MIRAAITLKLSAFEETGAIIAAHTTSIPEAPGSGRTWDYRFCWLRDAYFVVRALNRIGATRTMEDYISYILTIVTGHTGELQPVYSIVSTDPLEERIVADLKGYRGDGPVRIGNAAVAQNQHDTYGSVILAATPMFFDRRLPRMGDENLFRRLEPLGEMAAELALVPDAGIWEYRERTRIHTHSVAMCWAGCQRLEAIAAHLGLDDRAAYWGKHAARIHTAMLEGAWNREARRIHGGVRSDDLDASVLLLPELGAVEASDPRFVSTVERDRARTQARYQRYALYGADDFGLPETAFLICRFWLIDALWAIGRDGRMRANVRRRAQAAQQLRADVRRRASRRPKELWGNFPQTYSMAGIILSAIRLSQKLGGPVLARLVVVSNRVAVPDGKSGGRAGGLEVAVKAALRHRQGVWFGWSGKVARKGDAIETKTVDARRHRLRDHRPRHGGLPGILQRLRQPRAVADPALPLRPRRILAPRPVRLYAGQRAFRERARTRCCGPTTSSGCTTIT